MQEIATNRSVVWSLQTLGNVMAESWQKHLKSPKPGQLPLEITTVISATFAKQGLCTKGRNLDSNHLKT